jgi:hypothetical protein
MSFDPHEYAVHCIVSAMRFPGPDYYQVMQWLHEELRPESYVEIGVHDGHSLKLALPPTKVLGIDPCPIANHNWSTPTKILRMTSNELFAKHRVREFLDVDRFSLAFVDGLHHFEQAIDDIFNLEHDAGPDSVIAVHDTVPLDERTSMRERSTLFYTGDVWKVIPFLKRCRPDLEFVTVRTGPSGLTLIRRLDPSRKRTVAQSEVIGQFQRLSWQYYERHRDDSLETIPNERGAVVRWLCGSLLPSHRKVT